MIGCVNTTPFRPKPIRVDDRGTGFGQRIVDLLISYVQAALPGSLHDRHVNGGLLKSRSPDLVGKDLWTHVVLLRLQVLGNYVFFLREVIPRRIGDVLAIVGTEDHRPGG